jgi:L-asparagine transporter-like permease
MYLFFNGYGARPPVASIPYVVVLFFLLMYFVPKKVITFLGEDVVLLIVWIVSFVLLSYGSMRFSKLLKNRMDNKEKYSWLVLIFYLPLIIIISVWLYLATHGY